MNAAHRPIRVLHIASGDLWAGAEVQVAQLVGALAKRSGLELAVVLLNEGELADRMRRAGVLIRVIPEHQSSAMSVYRQLVTVMQDWRPNVVHTHRQKENILGALAARAARVPACLRTVHGAPEFTQHWWQLRKQVPRKLDRWIAQNLQQHVVAVSEELKVQLKRTLPGASVSVIPNGIDVDEIRMAAEPPVHLQEGLIHVAYIGRLVPVKRVDIFLRMAAELVLRWPNTYQFHVIGSGPLRPRLEQLSAELRLSTSCHFHGFHANAPRWLAAMNCMVLTSDHEGLPMTALEARALGVPVVAHAVGGLSSLLEGASDCRLVVAGDPNAIVQAIRSAAVASLDRTQSQLPERYRIDSTSAEYSHLYRTLLQ